MAGYIKNYAFLFIIMAITVSATYPATDTTAGERERGTLETLLTFPIKSKDIILGKFLGVTVSSVINAKFYPSNGRTSSFTKYVFHLRKCKHHVFGN